MLKKLRFALVALLLTVFAVQTTGCNRYGWELAGDVIQAVATVAIVATVLAYHDPNACSDRPYWVRGHEAYRCGNHWEYYDDYEGQWYYFEDGRY